MLDGTVFRLSPFAILVPPGMTESGEWSLVMERARIQVTITSLAAAVVALCAKPQTFSAIKNFFDERMDVSEDELRTCVSEFLQLKVLLTEDSTALVAPSVWSRYGWHSAGQYHRATQDTEFLGGTPREFDLSRQRMSIYADEAELGDRDRVKTIPEVNYLPLPAPRTSEIIDATVDEEKSINALLALSFCTWGYRKPRWNGAELHLRANPSGGGRHPTEGYLVSRFSSRRPAGVYHVRADPPSIGLIDPLTSGDQHLYPALIRDAPFEVRYCIILTTVFGRNSFRYRESRTFRTVHIDAGHVAANVEMVARASGWRSLVRFAVEEKKMEETLRIDGFAEGFQAVIALG